MAGDPQPRASAPHGWVPVNAPGAHTASQEHRLSLGGNVLHHTSDLFHGATFELGNSFAKAGWLAGIMTLVVSQPYVRRRAKQRPSSRTASARSTPRSVPHEKQHRVVASAVNGEQATGGTAGMSKEATMMQVMGVPLTADFTAVGMVYFAQGALGLAALAKPFLLKEELHLGPAEATLLLSLTYWPWALKPLWGFIADAFPLFGSRRRAYLLLSGLASAAGWFGLAADLPGETKESVLLLMMLGNLGIAFSDVVVDGLVVEKARDDSSLMGNLQSFCWASRGFGAVLSAYCSGALLEAWGVRWIFGLTGCLPLVVAVAASLIKESPKVATPQRSVGETFQEAVSQVRVLWDIVTSPEILPPVLFITLWQATPTSGSTMFYYFTNGLHFSPEFLGRAQLCSALASLGGIFLYNRFFSAAPLRQYLLRANLGAAALGLLPLILISRANLAMNIPDQAFVLGDDVIQTVAGELAHMPILVLAARLCPPGVEATLFALLMSLLNTAGLVASAEGSWLTSVLQITETDFSNLGLLVLICNLASFLPLAILYFVSDAPAAPALKGKPPKDLEEDALVPSGVAGG